MANDHFLPLPSFVWILRIVQLVLSVIILGLAAANVDVAPFDAHGLAVFTALFSIIILTYYLVTIHFVPKFYNWIVIVALEALAWIFWLATWAALAGLYADLNRSRRRIYIRSSLEKRSPASDYRGVFQAAIAFSVIQFVLFCVTAVFIGLASWRRYSDGRVSTGPNANSTPAAGTDLESNKPETAQAPPPQTPNGAYQGV